MARTDNTKVFFSAWYKEVFGFSDEVARALYDKQLLKNKTTLAELSDSDIDNIIRAIRRTLPIAEISAAQLKLAVFLIKHQDRTQREVGIPANPVVKVKLKTMLLLKTQKQLEDEWRLSNKEPDYPV
jgi:predicted ribosome quality control (RQC) complex YloA/Tae2 family protein